jgi:hypothetical protein
MHERRHAWLFLCALGAAGCWQASAETPDSSVDDEDDGGPSGDDAGDPGEDAGRDPAVSALVRTDSGLVRGVDVGSSSGVPVASAWAASAPSMSLEK